MDQHSIPGLRDCQRREITRSVPSEVGRSLRIAEILKSQTLPGAERIGVSSLPDAPLETPFSGAMSVVQMTQL